MSNIIFRNTVFFLFFFSSFNVFAGALEFNFEKDLLLLNYDLKTDVDDAHTVAAMDLVLRSGEYGNLNYYAVSGTYGKQGGLYVPANKLFDVVFKENWVDAHMYRKQAIDLATKKMHDTLSSGGRVWLAEAGQSDFTQSLLKQLDEIGTRFTKEQIVVVQHSEWNENETSIDALAYVKQRTMYKKIPDGNKEGNGSSGFNKADFSVKALENRTLKSSIAWKEANNITAQYNGVNGRYNNESIQNGGADFSDLAETIWILGIDKVENVDKFFNRFNQKLSVEPN